MPVTAERLREATLPELKKPVVVGSASETEEETPVFIRKDLINCMSPEKRSETEVFSADKELGMCKLESAMRMLSSHYRDLQGESRDGKVIIPSGSTEHTIYPVTSNAFLTSVPYKEGK